jgi:tRNA-specific 2-thiouridylase
MKKPIYVALSGGVDSSTVAALLVDAGYDVVGVYMKNWSSEFGIENNCPWEQDVADVEKVAKHLGIQWKVYNFEREYRERVLQYFFDEYKAGRTPNPDILCNNKVKFDLFLEKALSEGAEAIATGHYARRSYRTSVYPWEYIASNGLYTALDESKDQGYFLQRISEYQLSNATFPLGNFYKSEVRKLAKHFSLPVADKKDSQGICFIGDIDVRDFLKRELNTNPGEIVDIDTQTVVGKHQGLWFYTIGQRHGMGIGGMHNPYHVVKKDAEKNILYVGQGADHPMLMAKEITVGGVHAITSFVKDGAKIWVSLRYREQPTPASIYHEKNDSARIVFDTSAWAPAPGQSALIYEDDIVTPEKTEEADTKTLLTNFTNAQQTTPKRFTRIVGGGIIE